MSAGFVHLLRQATAFFCELNDAQTTTLRDHYELLTVWNKRLNLTSVRDIEAVVQRHYCESLFLGHHMDHQTTSVVDIGSGAGFPGIPVGVLRPDLIITLVESHQRKAVFLREAVRRLSNVSVFAGRVEELEQRVDTIIARAVRVEDVLREAPRLGGNLAILVGEDKWKEVLQNAPLAWQEPVRLPWGDRRLLVRTVPRET